jgi:hypothetical protein
VITLTLDGILCVIGINKNAAEKNLSRDGKSSSRYVARISKWVNLQASQAYSISLTQKWIIAGCTNGTIRFFKTTTLQHVLTLPKPPALGQYNDPYLKTGKADQFPDCVAIAFH